MGPAQLADRLTRYAQLVGERALSCEVGHDAPTLPAPRFLASGSGVQPPARACGDRHGPYAHYTFTAGRVEPTGRHHHLAFLAAAPWLRRRGIGSALLAAHHARLDRIGMPAVVEASSQRQRVFHERHGYRIVRVAHLPAGGPPLWAMRRSGDPVDQPPMAVARRVG